MTLDPGSRFGLDAGVVRAARAGMVALVSVGLGIACHAGAGGMAPPVTLQLVLLVGVGAVAFTVSRWRWTLPRLVVALLVVQALVHVGAVTTMPMGPMGQMSHGSGAAMLELHGVGTAVSAVLLRCGENLLWSLVERVGLSAARTIWAGIGPLASPRLWAMHPLAVPSGTFLERRLESRGPPVGLRR